MYCPKCGDVLVDAGHGLECTRGKMPLSKYLEGELWRAYPDEPGLRLPAGLGERPQGLGFAYCPGCGERLDPSLACPGCARSLWHWRFQLIELHPHLSCKTCLLARESVPTAPSEDRRGGE